MKAALLGYGKMGKEIEKILRQRGHEVVMIIDENNPGELTAENLRKNKVDVAIEFSTPASAYQNIIKCLEAGVGVVAGTTGWLERMDEVTELCRKTGGAFFYASNYGIGVNVFFRLNEVLARMMNSLPEYDVTVEEVHHTQKLDSPSGTAITIAEGILRHIDRKEKWVGSTTTTPGELEVLGIRRSVVPGIHTVTYDSEVDTITMIHSAKSRLGLASGAVMAAEFIKGKKGIFGMNDLLGF